ncbi:MAG TPA: hypothetical protein DCM54_05500 [Gammaproteobacteria bacterium]|nr:hypothetical protein [Gammaproteobacteria bacterium]
MNTITRLSQFGFLAVNGRDAKTFMQGYTTCDVEKLSERENLGAICNLKGRMVTNFRIASTDEGLLLRMHKSSVQDTMEFLSKYIVFSKAELIDVSDHWHCHGVVGDTDDADENSIRLRVNDTRYELWSTSSLGDESDAEDWAAADCADGLAWIESATADHYLPQMFNLHELGGIDFEKGCYLGQEIVARAQYLGDLKRALHHTRFEQSLAVGDELQVTGRPIGSVVSVAAHDALAVVANPGENTIAAESPDGESLTFTAIAPT